LAVRRFGVEEDVSFDENPDSRYEKSRAARSVCAPVHSVSANPILHLVMRALRPDDGAMKDKLCFQRRIG
jgi:hypothetical protein